MSISFNIARMQKRTLMDIMSIQTSHSKRTGADFFRFLQEFVTLRRIFTKSLQTSCKNTTVEKTNFKSSKINCIRQPECNGVRSRCGGGCGRHGACAVGAGSVISNWSCGVWVFVRLKCQILFAHSLNCTSRSSARGSLVGTGGLGTLSNLTQDLLEAFPVFHSIYKPSYCSFLSQKKHQTHSKHTSFVAS